MVEPGGSAGLWFRWSWRDLRHHWVAVIAIALVISIGIGVYAGLGSTSTWRRLSNDESFAALHMHDLRVELSPGTFVETGVLADALTTIDDAGSVTAASERLVVDSQVDATVGAESVLVAARLVGMDLDGQQVDDVWVRDGQVPVSDGSDVPQGIVELKFADHWGLPEAGSITMAGNRRVDYTGLGMIPEDFFYEGPEGSILSEGDLAPVYLPLAQAQDVAGRVGQVNDLVLTLGPSADRDAVEAQLRQAVDEAGVSAVVTNQDDALAFRILYEDIDNDQRFWNALAALVLLAAALAAFNLISRIVEAQRREIGIGMALGVSPGKLALRPLLIGTQVAVLGTLAGIGVGMMVGQAMAGLLKSFLPLPIYQTPFQFGVFAQAAVLGLLIPIVASAIPVWRAVRVEPIEAIRTGHLAAKTSRLTDWTGRIRLPGSSLTQIPLRNVMRTPRRTILTALGVGAAITALVAVLGMLDSFTRTIDEAGMELTQDNDDRILVQLETFYPADGDVVASVADASSIGEVDPSLRIPITAVGRSGFEDLEILVELLDFDTAVWTPTLIDGQGGPGGGVVLAQKAADDLGVVVGDPVVVRHPVRVDAFSFSTDATELEVTGIHANPLRTFAFMDLDEADRFGLAGAANLLHVYPAEGATRAEVQRDVFDLQGITSSQAVARISEGFDEALAQFVGFLVITASAVLALALLIAFNATRITVDERRREHATMQAFGLPARSVMGVVVKESVIIGVVATVIGVVAGAVFLQWMLGSLATTTLPDLGITRYISPATLAIAAGVGIVAVAVAPLFLTRRITKMNIPDTLRMME